MIDRRAFYDQRAAFRVRETGRCYQQLLRKQYAFWVPPGLRVLEVGCGLGDLLAAVEAGPRRGRGFQPGHDRAGAASATRNWSSKSPTPQKWAQRRSSITSSSPTW